MNQAYNENGYAVIKRLFSPGELQPLTQVVNEFHQSWLRKNTKIYTEGAINSAYLTGTEHLGEVNRKILFDFIGSAKLMKLVFDVMSKPPAFMNTQLFFNPVNTAQKNYWHRDAQYHLTPKEQQAALTGPEVLHFRIPLVDEPGIELIPGTHRRWDSEEELAVRLEHNGRKNWEDLTSGISIELAAGDLLVFSANMMHRGLYGMNRLSLDILFCDPEPSLLKFVNGDCLPNQQMLRGIEVPSAFLKTTHLLEKGL